MIYYFDMMQKSSPLVSIIIPVYNVEDYIGKCVNSLLNQSYSNIEYIFVDDCGTDKSVLVAKQIIDQHPRKGQVKWIFQEKNLGQSVARNTGVEHSVGDYIFFVDSDDYISLDCIETHMMYMVKYQPEMVVGGAQDQLFEGEAIFPAYSRIAWGKTPWNRLVSKEFLQKNHIVFQQDMIFEDMIWNLYVTLNAKRVYTFKKKTYFYMIRENSSCHQVTRFRFDSFVKMITETLAIFQERGLIVRKEAIQYFELLKLGGLNTFGTTYTQWKWFRSVLKIKLVPTWKLLLGLYGKKLQIKVFLSLLPWFLYKPVAYCYFRYIGLKNG